MPEIVPESPEVEALTRTVQQQFAQIIGMTPYLPEELQLAAANIDDPTAAPHLIASTLRLKTEERQELLETVDVERPRPDRPHPRPRARDVRARLESSRRSRARSTRASASSSSGSS